MKGSVRRVLPWALAGLLFLSATVGAGLVYFRSRASERELQRLEWKVDRYLPAPLESH